MLDTELSRDEWSRKARCEPESLPAHSTQDESVLPVDEVRKAATTAVTLRQLVEHCLDDMDTYTREDLLKLCQVYILKRPATQVLVECQAMFSSGRGKFVVLDTQNSLLFWQGSATHHLRKLNVRAQSYVSCDPALRCPTHPPPRAGAHDNSDIFTGAIPVVLSFLNV